MRLLLDTNVFLWWQWGDSRLSMGLRDAIEDDQRDVTVSAVTIWEISIKRQIGKLKFSGSPTTACHEAGFRLLDITPTHAELAGDLPRHHGDPFDRMLIAQAKLEDFVLATAGRQFLLYDVPVLGVS